MQHIFTHDFILGQLSIVAPLAVVIICLKVAKRRKRTPPVSQPIHINSESTEWLNALLHQVAIFYRFKLRDDPQGVEGLRRRVEHFVNLKRPSDVMDRIQVHSVNLGVAAPHISNASSRLVAGSLERSEFEMVYKDDISISLSTVYYVKYPIIFNPTPLPISVTVGLSVFSCCVVITPLPLSSPAPTFTLSILPNFTLDLKSSLKPMTFLGSPKLTNVPILHGLIENQLRAALSQWGTSVEVVLPGLDLFSGDDGVA
ncbi:hypothetical protein BJV77DRAFT_969996 [Russula vinacea]|nr:hypothetical protein BJV77DRAFT_969996 [Russula vinacea]